ncbi:MAG TPA: alanine--tRNA ligase, partial [Thermoproteota archaeon]|nr:alanine--tRNA ligase [Thermoproteota archaeon]
MQSFPPEEYSLKIFKSLGYARKKSEIDGDFYWVHQNFKGQCGESPLVPYSFIGKPMGKKTSDLDESRDRFLSFFKHKGHTIVSPYPVVSRWRNDLYLTDASIVDFQPYVTDGMIPPPANPLVISQPCIRLIDLDNVGLTFGRHMSIFEMGGHHAFNSKEKEVYWKEETVGLCDEFFSKAMGIPSEDVIYKESAWFGGGNAGPCFEVITGGLEVATLVFMRFKTSEEGKLSESPIRTVDTGYGIERMLWVTSGSPSPMFVVHPKVVRFLSKEAKVDVDEMFDRRYIEALSGIGNNQGGLPSLRSAVSSKLGITPKVLEDRIGPLERIFRVADHTKSLIFILSEGVVPSNVGVGYLARLLFRRSARMMRSLGLLNLLPEVVTMQVDYWAAQFPHLGEQKSEILKVASVELEKYTRNYERSVELIERTQREEGPAAFQRDRLIQLYDSQGITPEEVSDILETTGTKLGVPPDFYSLVAARHTKQLQTPARPEVVVSGLEKLPQTQKIYYEDPELLKSEGVVVATVKPDGVVFDKTIFYPEGGGQPSDAGKVSYDKTEIKVIAAENQNGVIIHKIVGPLPREGTKVTLEVDEDRRMALRRAHTGTHIVNWAARMTLGSHLWQHGAQKGVQESRLDVTHYDTLTDEEIRKIEELANRLVMKIVPVKIEFLGRTEAESKYGFRIYQGGVVPSKILRIVSVGEYDVEACGGLHVSNTGQIGMIKIVNVDKIQDGVVRISFTTGLSSLNRFQEEENSTKQIAEIMRTDRTQVVKTTQRMLEDLQTARKELESVKQSEARQLAERLGASLETVGGMKVSFYEDRSRPVNDLITVSRELVSSRPDVISITVSSAGEFPEFALIYGERATPDSRLTAAEVA